MINCKTGYDPVKNGLHSNKNPNRREFFILYPAIFLLSLFLYTAYNGFPEDYHPDEDRKVKQVKTGEYDFRHPALLIDTARLVVFVSGGVESNLDYCIRGRWASAILASLGVAALTGAAHILYGRYAALSTGIAVALCPMLLESAHYMKEDAALVFGISCVALGIAFLKRGISSKSIILIGVACALAASAKYVGIFLIIPALISIMTSAANSAYARLKRLALFFSSFIAVILLINYQGVIHPSRFLDGLHYETEHVSTSHDGLIFRRFGGYYSRIIGDVTDDIVIVLALFYLTYALLRWRYISAQERLLALLPLGYYALISFSHVQSPRYVIPVVVLMHWLAGLGVVAISLIVRRRRLVRNLIRVSVLAALAIILGVHSIDYLRQFKNDSRREFEEWVRANIDPNAHILQEWYVSLPEDFVLETENTEYKIPVKTTWCAAGYSSLDGTRKAGFTHVAVSAIAYSRFFDSDILPDENYDTQFYYWRPRQFYAELFNKGVLLWESRQSRTIHGFTNPVIRFYDIRETADMSQSADN